MKQRVEETVVSAAVEVIDEPQASIAAHVQTGHTSTLADVTVSITRELTTEANNYSN